MPDLFNGDLAFTTTVRQLYRDLYDAIALAFHEHKVPLTEPLLRNTIPTAIFEHAVLSEWVPEPTKEEPKDPVPIGRYTIERHQAKRFMELLRDQIDFWLSELESDKDRLWEDRVKRLMPRRTDPTTQTPATLLEEYRIGHSQTNWESLAKSAAKHCRAAEYDAILSAIYRIVKGTNVSQRTLECIAAALSAPGRKIEWSELRWPKKQRRRASRKTANK